MSIIIDRRLSGKNKSIENREKFKHRHDRVIRQAVRDLVHRGSIKDVIGDKELTIPMDEDEYSITTDDRNYDRVFIGNKKYRKGDTIPKSGGGGQRGFSGEGEDAFRFRLTAKEFEQYLFDELEIPNLERKSAKELSETQYRHAGFKSSGIPAQLSIIRSFKSALGRVISLEASYDEQLQELAERLANEKDPVRRKQLQLELEDVQHMRDNVPFLDDIDLRYRHKERQEIPITKAVMVCLMDVSGSMDEDRKDLAKRFYILLYLFLRQKYTKFDIVFIRHTETAELCTEEEFFYDSRSGGTDISEGLKLVDKVITEQYPLSEYNVYLAHASDGEDFDITGDKPMKILLDQGLLDKLNMYLFIGTRLSDYDPYVSKVISHLTKRSKKVELVSLERTADVFPAFIDVFKRKPAKR